MRNSHPESWFRIHSLPDSKRYPETETEWTILIDRHRKLSNKVLGNNADCRIHYYLFADEDFPSHLDPELDWRSSLVLTDYDDEKIYVKTAAACWNFDAFLPWIKLRSDDVLAWLSFHSLNTDSIYSPYDGGADVFSDDHDFLNEIRTEFSSWKSKHPAGL